MESEHCVIEAFHMIGFSNLDRFRMNYEQYHAGIIAHTRERYEHIVQDRFLRPMQGDSGNTFALDSLAGDDLSIFLSVEKRYWASLEAANFGFVFDAEQLIEAGAILRSRDLLVDYQDLHEKVTQQFIPRQTATSWSDDDLDTLSPNEAFYALLDAIEHGNADYPQAKEAIAMLKTRMVALQRNVQLTKSVALRVLRSGKAAGYEVLVKEKLSIEDALAHIVAGNRVAKRK
jgi:hypothetical protein